MSAILRIPIVLLLLAAVFSGDDPYCPAYPQPVRQAYLSGWKWNVRSTLRRRI